MKTYQTYRTRSEAQAEIDCMRGWDAKITSLYLPDDVNADEDGNVIVIECDNGKHLCADGYVR